MRPVDIKEGVTYKNRGKGRTQRTVLRIGLDIPAPWHSPNDRPNDPVVEFSTNGRIERLYLTSFAAWAGGVVSAEKQ